MRPDRRRRETSSDYAMAADAQAKKDRHMVSWTQQEDDLLREQVALHGSDNWTIIAAKFKGKTGRQCRRRLTYLNTECKKGGWSQEEDMLLCEAHKIFGNRWTEIAKVVSGRTDNAVKNRFSTICKKRAKHHTISKENKDYCIYPSNKKIMMEPSTNKQLIRCGGSNRVEDISSLERLAATYDIHGVKPRPPLAVLTQNFNSLSCFPSQFHLDSGSICPTTRDAIENCEVRGNFLRKDDPKVSALLQQADLLSSLAVKAYSENKNHSLEDVWKELQNYLIQTREDGNLSSFSEMDALLDNCEGEFIDFHCVDKQTQLSRRNMDREGSQSNSGMGPACPHEDPGKDMDKLQLGHCSIDYIEGQSHFGSFAPVKFFCQGELMPSSLEFAQTSVNPLVSSKSEFDSPLKTIRPFHSFTEDIPSPEFSSSERKFLLCALGVSSSKPFSNANQTPCKRDPRPNSSQSHSCKRVLLDSL